MKNLKTKLTETLAILMVALFAVSCVDTDNNNNDTFYQEIVTIGASEDGQEVWFEGTNGKYLANGTPTTVNFHQYDGNRALLYFSISNKMVPGYDKVVNVAAISVATTVFGVETASTAEELSAFGNEPLQMEKADTHLQGKWLDTMVSYYTNSEVKSEFTLVAPDHALIDPNVTVPDGYLYLELHQKVDKKFAKVTQNKIMLSFQLPDEYRPSTQGYKGIYLRIDNGSAAANYVTIDNIDD